MNMNALDKATQTQLNNIQTRTGKTLDELAAYVQSTGLTKHGEIRAALMSDLGLGYGDANTLAHLVLKSDGATAARASGASTGDLTGEMYTGPKATLRPIHDRLMAALDTFGPYEIAPKKGYFSFRRKKQFAMFGPTTNTRVELGLNVKGLPASDRLQEMRPGEMCQYKVKLASPDEVDPELIDWIKQAYDSAG